MFAGAFSSAIANLLIALLVLAGLAVYLTLIRQISTRRTTIDPAPGALPVRTFGVPEMFLAAALILFVLINITAAAGHSSIQLTSRDLIANLLFTLFVVLFIAITVEEGFLGGRRRRRLEARSSVARHLDK